MEIKTATANLSGGYDLTFEKGDPATVTTRDRTPEALALLKWMQAGNKPSSWSPSLSEAKVAASAQVERQFSDLMVMLTGSASVEERDTWAIKEAAARAHIAGDANPSQAAMLASEAGTVGEDVNALAVNIIGKAEAFYALVGVASGMKRAAHKTIQDAKSTSALTTALAALADQRDAAVAAISA